jgi:hypothetical protein
MSLNHLLPPAAVAATLLLVGCSGSDSTPMTPTSQIRVLHASPDAPAVDVTAGATTLVTNAAYKDATAFRTVPAGSTAVKVNVAGTSTTVINATVNLRSDKVYTVIAANAVASLEPLVIEEDPAAPPAGQVAVRVVHAAPQVGAVDVYVTAPGASLTTATPTLAAVPFKGVSNRLTIPAATYQVRITGAGSKSPVYDSGSVALAAGSNLVLGAVAQDQGASPVTLLGLTRQAASPKLELPDNRTLVRVMHASPDAPAVDVLVNGSVALPSVSYPTNSAYLPLGSGATNLKVNLAGTATTALNADLTLVPTQTHSVYAVGFAAGLQSLVVADDLRAPAAGKAKLRVIHASPDAGNVDVLVNGTAALTNVPFKAAANYLVVDAGAYTVKLNAAGTATTALTANVNLTAGKIYTAIAIGSTASGAANPLSLKLITDN